MFKVSLLSSLLLGVVLGDPDPNPSPSFPGYGQFSQGGSYNDGGSDARGPGWGTSSGGFVVDNYNSGDTGWGSTRCGSVFRRSRCVPTVFDIESQLLGTAQKMSSFCNAYSNRPLREVYGVEHFKLLVEMSDFSEHDIQVRVRQRLVTILASTCSAEYAAVRVLPDVADARHAVWKMDGNTLTVLFPYYIISPDTQIQSRCGREFHGDPIIVPKCAAATQFVQDYDVDFTDEKFKTAIRRALREINEEDNLHYVDD